MRYNVGYDLTDMLRDRSMVFVPNDSPLAGQEGSQLTGTKIGERLAEEAATSVSLRVTQAGSLGFCRV